MKSQIITHKHHIIPKHAGGTDDPSNLVELTVEEHALAHKKLYEQYGNFQDKLAWQGLKGMIPKQEIISQLMSNLSSGENNPMYGRSAIIEQNLKWYTDGTENIYVTEDTQPKGFYNGRSGIKRRPASPETKKKISESLKGNIPPNRLSVIAPDGKEFPSIKFAANSLNLTVSQFKHRFVNNGDWVILR